jgi:hypothetical protein
VTNTAPLWVPLLVAGLGLVGTVLGTIGGVLLTQRRSDRREAIAWQRERQREKEQWAREDSARTFDQRRDSYVDFTRTLRAAAQLAHNRSFFGEPESGELPDGWQYPTFLEYQRLRLYATPEVAEIAIEAYRALWQWGIGERNESLSNQSAYLGLEDRLFEAMRKDLGVPDTIAHTTTDH